MIKGSSLCELAWQQKQKCNTETKKLKKSSDVSFQQVLEKEMERLNEIPKESELCQGLMALQQHKRQKINH